MPTREQLIQQANLRADWEEAKERGEPFELEYKRWDEKDSSFDRVETPSWYPHYEYRRSDEPEPPLDVWLVGSKKLVLNSLLKKCGCSILTTPGEAKEHREIGIQIIHLREVQE